MNQRIRNDYYTSGAIDVVTIIVSMGETKRPERIKRKYIAFFYLISVVVRLITAYFQYSIHKNFHPSDFFRSRL